MRPPPNLDIEHRWDKLGLFMLAGLVVLVLGAIVGGVYWRQTVPDKGDVLLGGISTGLILFLRDLVNAVRSSWEEVTRGKQIDSLTNSSPPAPPAPQDAKQAADQVADAAVESAEQIGGKGGG